MNFPTPATLYQETPTDPINGVRYIFKALPDPGYWAVFKDELFVSSSLADVFSSEGFNLGSVPATQDKILFWDLSEEKLTYLSLGTGLEISGTSLNVTVTTAGLMPNSVADANSILYAVTDNTPAALALAANKFPARSSAGNIEAKDITDAALTVLDDATVGAMLATLGGMAASGGTMTNGTIAGTVTFGTGAQANMFAALGSGTPSDTTYLRGDGTWAAAGGFSGTANRITVGGTADSNLESTISTSGTNAMVNVVSLAVPAAVGLTNVALLLTPKGTGAIIAGPLPDGTNTGGNVRGSKAVDLQNNRWNATHVASGANSFLAGDDNTAAGTGSGAIGASNAVSGNYSFANGYQNTVSGYSSFAYGQSGQLLTEGYCLTGGLSASATRYGQHSVAAGMFAAVGDAQRCDFVLRCKTTTNAAVEMALDGATAYLTVPSGKVIAMLINVSGIKSDGSACAHYCRQYAVKNVGGTTSEVYAAVTVGTDNAAGTTLALSANNTGDYVSIQPTGVTSEVWRWVAHVEAVEIAYGT